MTRLSNGDEFDAKQEHARIIRKHIEVMPFFVIAAVMMSLMGCVVAFFCFFWTSSLLEWVVAPTLFFGIAITVTSIRQGIHFIRVRRQLMSDFERRCEELRGDGALAGSR